MVCNNMASLIFKEEEVGMNQAEVGRNRQAIPSHLYIYNAQSFVNISFQILLYGMKLLATVRVGGDDERSGVQ